MARTIGTTTTPEGARERHPKLTDEEYSLVQAVVRSLRTEGKRPLMVAARPEVGSADELLTVLAEARDLAQAADKPMHVSQPGPGAPWRCSMAIPADDLYIAITPGVVATAALADDMDRGVYRAHRLVV